MGALVEIFCVVAEAMFATFEKREVKPGCLTFSVALVLSGVICYGIVLAVLWIAARLA